jgi:putative DNA primase/helicase
MPHDGIVGAINGADPHPPPGVILTSLADVEMRPIDWLWLGWLARGKLHLIAGAPGTGKTTIAMSMVATVTRGGCWPDGTTAPLGNAVIWSGEDDIADGLKPRLMAAGADDARVRVVRGTRTKGGVQAFDPAADMDGLIEVLRPVRPALLVLDPIVSFVTGDSHKNAEVRRSLQPLVELAAEIGCAVFGVTHYAKGTQGRDPAERVVGSGAFTALPRVVMATAAAAEEGEPNRLVRAKSNIGPTGGGFGYTLSRVEVPGSSGIEGQVVIWGDALDGGARELLNEVEDVAEGGGSARDAAMGYLRSVLADGPCRALDVEKDAAVAGHAARTLRRAADALGVVKKKVTRDGATWWEWSLPG